ncbi:HAD-like protein [Rhizodiscina lignyota]|uniref:HAD-like protein n=1 Tax=Rhizodiscina lignyota TaxID=1504668 RepID=A0A9P4I4I2_9PEZI|nr:HAD-like protein [Rhizodiscina lignyota]
MAQSNPPPVRACLFDMDGLLIDSEELYTLITNDILREYGKPDLPWSIKAQMQGRPGPESALIFHNWAQLPITHEQFMEKQKPLQAHYFPRSQPLPGTRELLESFKRTSPRVHIALATSSHKRNFELKTTHLPDFFSVFDDDHVVLGDDPRIPKGRGKPAPDIYLLALKTINEKLRQQGSSEIEPEECLVFEDSVPGVEAGRRAGMQVVWCPHVELLAEYKGREKEVLAGLTGEHKDDELKDGEKAAKDEEEDVSGKEKKTKSRIPGSPGEIDDGWGRLFTTLEDFPFEEYGIKVQSKI